MEHSSWMVQEEQEQHTYCALLDTPRSKRYITLPTGTSGVAASKLPPVGTLHSRFKLPFNINDNITCSIAKSNTAELLKAAKPIIWD